MSVGSKQQFKQFTISSIQDAFLQDREDKTITLGDKGRPRSGLPFLLVLSVLIVVKGDAL